MNIALAEQQRKRWYELIDHPVQMDLMAAVGNGVRFPVVPAGRRSGKTERAKRFVAKEAMDINKSGELYFLAAPTRDQVKKIFWEPDPSSALDYFWYALGFETGFFTLSGNRASSHAIVNRRRQNCQYSPLASAGHPH